MTNAESICLTELPAEAPAQEHSENGAPARLTPAELNSKDARSSSIVPHADNAATAPHWEHFLKGKFQLEVEIPT